MPMTGTRRCSVYCWKTEHIGDARYEKIRTVFTIHNLKYQGVFPKTVMDDVLGLDWKYLRMAIWNSMMP